jgi:hypothetical protein
MPRRFSTTESVRTRVCDPHASFRSDVHRGAGSFSVHPRSTAASRLVIGNGEDVHWRGQLDTFIPRAPVRHSHRTGTKKAGHSAVTSLQTAAQFGEDLPANAHGLAFGVMLRCALNQDTQTRRTTVTEIEAMSIWRAVSGGLLKGTPTYSSRSVKMKIMNMCLPTLSRGFVARTYIQIPVPNIAISTTIVPGIEFQSP